MKSLPDPVSLTNCIIGRPLRAPDQRPPPEAPHHPDRLPHDPLRHLALAFTPIGERDRDFGDPKLSAPRPIRHLDLKGVAVGANGAEIDLLEHASPKALE